MNPGRIVNQKSRHILIYSVCCAVLVFLLKWLQWKFLISDNSIEIYIGLIALFFTALGIWVATHLVKPKIKTVEVEKQVIVEKQVLVDREIIIEKVIPAVPAFTLDQQQLQKLEISPREFEVLQMMNEGRTNAEIAAALFLSLSTIKTHASNLFFKLDARNRTQAINRARELRLIA